MIVRSRTPLRLGFAGGGTDVAPFRDEHGGCVLNATIGMYAHAILATRADGRVRFVAADRDECLEAASERVPDLGPLALHRAVHRRMVRDFNAGTPLSVTLTTYCDVPAGSGLGSSSTLVVAMVEAFKELLGLSLSDYEVADLAYRIERHDLGLLGGKQDQYAATFGGVNFMEFAGDDKVVVNPLRVRDIILTELETSLVLYFTGVSRHSATIIEEQARNMRDGDATALGALHEIKADAVAMKEALLKGEIPRFASLMGRSWEAKKRTARNVTSARIDRLYDMAIKSGAYAGKVSGAGGGGFMMFMVDPVRRMELIRVLEGEDGTVIPCNFTHRGSETWRTR
jgi:D-glycero-alpha-D-manno-heptose-7-phosphate kinase